MGHRGFAAVLLVGTLSACGGAEDEQLVVDPPPPGACQRGELPRDDGSCQAAGVPEDMRCPPGELELAGGGCQAAGVTGCAAGFEAAPDGGCRAILPAMACPKGQLALPGETACHEVGDCGSGTWGNIDTSGEVQYVDASFQGVSDGSPTAPWTTINEAVAAAAADATVAVAAGTYPEDVPIAKRISLWGRCASMVEIAGLGGDIATVYVQGQATGATVRGVALTGPEIGIVVAAVANVTVEEIWSHDNGFRSADFESASVTLRHSLLELGVGEGLFQQNGVVTVEGSVIRDTKPEPSGLYGRGIGTQSWGASRAQLDVRGSIIERNHEAGVGVFGADALIEDSLLRSNEYMPGDGTSGWGLWVNHDGNTNQRSEVSVSGSVLEDNYDSGAVVVGSNATFDNSTVRTSKALPSNPFSGTGVVSRNKYTVGERALVTLNASVVSENVGIGVYVLGADASLNGSVVRATALSPSMPPIGGRGIDVEPDPLSDQASTASVIGCVVEEHYDQGIFGASSDLVIDATVVRNIEAIPDGRFGRGINIQLDSELQHLPASATVTRTLVEGSHEAGLAVLAASATIEQSTFRDPRPRPSDGWMGRGVMVQYGPGIGVPAYASLAAVRVESSYDSGIFVSGAEVSVHDSVVKGTQPREADQLFGDGITGLVGPTDTLVEVARTRIEQSARAGVSGFSARLVLADNRLECNGFDLAWQAFGAGGGLEDEGGNVCGCGAEEVVCKATSAMLEAPAPLD